MVKGVIFYLLAFGYMHISSMLWYIIVHVPLGVLLVLVLWDDSVLIHQLESLDIVNLILF